MKIAVGRDSYIEPDDGPRNTRFHMRIVRKEPIRGTQSGMNVTLECGHGVQTYGDLSLAGGVLLCAKCRDLEEAS
jgi:hypothetical protein